MKKFVSVILAAAMMFSLAVMFTGCGEGGEYPVKIANIKIEKEPERIIVLDASTADIINYMGYSGKIAGRSESVDQPELAKVPSVGGKVTPNIDNIIKLEADLVLCDPTISEGSRENLIKKGIQVISLQEPGTETEVKTNYITIGKILSGNNKGASVGADTYDMLTNELEELKSSAASQSGNGAMKTVCYLYLNNGKLSKLSGDNYGNVLLGYTNCVNIFSAGGTELTDISKVVAGANPSYIFYNDEPTLRMIKKNDELSKIDAVKNDKMMRVPLSCFSRPGETAKKTVAAMNDFIYKGKVTNLKESASEQAQETTQAATKAASQAESQPEEEGDSEE